MRLLLDAMLGNLATYLRLCGHDTVYALDRDVEADEAVLGLATAGDRTLVTRDEQLATQAEQSILLRDRDTEPQLRELATAGVDLTPAEEPVHCGRCNGRLVRVDATDSDARPDYVPDHATPVWRCRNCDQRFWKGSHWDRMVATLADVRDASGESATGS
ncbi:Mut7-C RNAse domain-containing protein [Haloarchaeobius litoreus]|uniref:Mut7-C RNAse domain-containing protein n=1 Tax=Haloarchaeobius litoreus TaxID=755306 RepID=A0ABD6DI41_9EURY|nr:Mut7-C RNAse domain-containing protein [Haloarchaeobius litoreus]